MSIACCIPVLECVYCLACARWAWKRCLHTGSHDSDSWGLATADEFKPVPHLCRLILSVYEDDLEQPQWAPPGGYGINPQWVHHRRSYEHTEGHAPPYLVYVDHENHDVVLAIRGMNMVKESDYAVLLDNRLGERQLDGGYVHNGLLKAAEWVFESECETLKEILNQHSNYRLTFAGHSLGSGVAALLAMVAVQNRARLRNLERQRIRCFAFAPARCVSLNLAVRYADVINSVVLQDDFLPRTATPLEDIFKSLFCLPCLLCIRCMVDTCIPENVMLRDPRRLYAPGRLYHIVERKPFRCGRFPPVVKTAVPVDGRFERIVLSCNATSDHAIIWIEREAQKALDIMLEKEKIMGIPPSQRMDQERRTHAEEQQVAIQRIADLSIPDTCSPYRYGTFDDNSVCVETEGSSSTWGKFITKAFITDESGKLVPKT
ncbi:Sn1-specific diacylglycerol lipase alpha [Rhynchospora pubera]|uniref:Sn1-specific diacylglycerol lipase alpha n=1 Tax=Rhynchospora pubera TaxID=906938 RepID=A0AAV8ALG5_9POAL|nr:Sn1-specific diacylglycerol lipase alpha [Rhynchospora pubera]KAJ4744326.1 Sn1-specific diacylglycerol lipase alpha [Rhynchospora pubera]KAJ4805741.1 Sn1-specific diacylglycerol lipase alpha [Rhynchospora pubera]